MRAGISVALFCGSCHMALEHHTEFVRCPNKACEQYGEKWQAPTIELEPYVEPQQEPSDAAG